MSDASPGSAPARSDDAHGPAAAGDCAHPEDAAQPASASHGAAAQEAVVPQPSASPLVASPAEDQPSAAATAASAPTKGPVSFLSGALTSGALAWLALGLSRRVVAYYSLHPPLYEARLAQSIATALKTLIVGMCFLATFSFAFVGLGLFLVFLRSLLGARRDSPA